MDHIMCHFEIPADQPEKLAAFYTSLFGWQITAAPGMEGSYWFVRTSEEDGALGGGLMATREPRQGILNYVLVEDVDAYAAQAQALGATLVVPRTEVPGMGWYAVVDDPQGNRVGMFQPHPDSMPGQA